MQCGHFDLTDFRKVRHDLQLIPLIESFEVVHNALVLNRISRLVEIARCLYLEKGPRVRKRGTSTRRKCFQFGMTKRRCLQDRSRCSLT